MAHGDPSAQREQHQARRHLPRAMRSGQQQNSRFRPATFAQQLHQMRAKPRANEGMRGKAKGEPEKHRVAQAAH
jgi:hypothetical protein